MPELLASALSREHSAELLRLEREEMRRLVKLYKKARREVIGRLAQVGAETFTAQHVRVARAQIEHGLRTMLKELKDRHEKLTETLLTDGIRQTLEEIAEWEPRFRRAATGRIQLTALRKVAQPKSLLLHRYGSSIQAYGNNLISEVQGRLGVHLAMRSSWRDMSIDIAGRLKQHAIAGSRYRAERIVRTEMSDAINTGHQAGLDAASRILPDLMKQWDSTLDSRTSEVCKRLHGTVRRLNGVWTWQGRKIARPPALPQCRSRVIPWRAEWAEIDETVKPEERRRRLAPKPKPKVAQKA